MNGEAKTSLKDHPTVRKHREATPERPEPGARPVLDAAWLRQLCLDSGADDVGFVEIGRPEIDDQRDDVLRHFPGAKTLISFACRMNRGPIRSPARSASNQEFHETYDHTNDAARKIVTALEALGVRALNPPAGFPMEMSEFPGKIWIVSHKPVAVAAGLGRMGIHRNVIHPKFGNFIALGTVLTDAEVSEVGKPIDYNPCLGCKLCVAACPVGAISPEGGFNFVTCMTHNYREFMGGFHDWVGKVADSRDDLDYRRKVNDGETASLWQSLAFGPNYKAAYCLAVCPAGEDVIGPFLDDRPNFLKTTVKPLTDKEETVYVVPGSDAEEYVPKRFPRKSVKRVSSGIRPRSIDVFLRSLSLAFQPGKAKGIDAVYHFTFTGGTAREATVVIRSGALDVRDGHHGSPDLRVVADSATWLGFLAKERSLAWAILRRKIVLKGSPRLLISFGRCFPL